MISRLWTGLQGLGNIFFAPYYANKTNQEMLTSLGFPIHLVPNELIETPKDDGPLQIINFSTDETIQKKLDHFMTEILALNSQIKALHELVNNIPLPNHVQLNDVKFNGSIPENLLDPITKRIMTLPLTINKNRPDECDMDLQTIMDFWTHDKFALPTFLDKKVRVVTIELNTDLQKIANEFVRRTINKTKGCPITAEEIQEKIKKIQSHIEKLKQTETSLAILERKKLKKEIPTELHPTGDIMTHPVIIDGDHVICFLELQAIWEARRLNNESPIHLNPFTHRQFRTLTYDTRTKEKLDEFLEEAKPKPVSTTEILRPILLSAQLKPCAPPSPPVNADETPQPARSTVTTLSDSAAGTSLVAPLPLQANGRSPLLFQSQVSSVVDLGNVQAQAISEPPKAGFQVNH